DAVGGQEPSRAEAEPLLRLVRDPVLVRVDLRPLRPRLAADLAVDGPAVRLVGGQHVGGHQEIAGGASPLEADVQVRGAHVDADADRTHPVLGHAPPQVLLSAGGGRVAPAGRRQLLAGERTAVRRQQAAAGRREVTGGAAGVLAGQEDRLRSHPARPDGDERERGRGEPPHWTADGATADSTSDTFTCTCPFTPSPMYCG